MTEDSRRVAGAATEAATGRWARVLSRHAAHLPPSPHDLPVRRTPHPPELSAELPLPELAYHCALAYSAACRAHYAFLRDPAKGGLHGFTATPGYLTCAAAAQTLLAEHIAPAAWCAFSVERWLNARHGHTRSAPQLAWVYGPKRLIERRAWFEDERSKWAGGRLLVSPARRAYAAQYDRVRCEVLTSPAQDEGAVIAAVRHVFGTPERARALADFVAATERTESMRLEALASRHEFIW